MKQTSTPTRGTLSRDGYNNPIKENFITQNLINHDSVTLGKTDK